MNQMLGRAAAAALLLFAFATHCGAQSGSQSIQIPTPNFQLSGQNPGTTPSGNQQPALQVGTVSGPLCGGLDSKGQLQPPCPPQPATLLGAVSNGGCPPGQDTNTLDNSCSTCPAGYSRTGFPVNGDRACVREDASVEQAFFPARELGKLCPGGSFYDPARDGECWQCPAGFNRSVFPVAGPNACVSNGNHREATIVRKGTCETGSFMDLANGVSCWSCPADTHRTINPVTGPRACVRTAGRSFARATILGRPAGCGPGNILDLFSIVTEQDLQAMITLARNAGNSGEANRLSQIRPSQVGGSCWSCPTNYRRSAAPIKGPQACVSNQMQWRSAPIVELGLFGLQGADQVLLELVKLNPKFVLDSLRQAGIVAERRIGGQPRAQETARERQALTDTPEKSAVASAMLFARVMAAATEPGKASPAELLLLDSFRREITRRRTYIAQEALDAYRSWKKLDDTLRARKAQLGPASMTDLLDYGTVPPDFSNIALLGGIANGLAGTAIGVATSSLPVVGDVLATTLSEAGSGFSSFSSPQAFAVATVRTASETVVSKAAEYAVERLAKAAADKVFHDLLLKGGLRGAQMASESILTTAGSAGPQIIIGAAIMVLSIAIDQVTDIATAEARLNSALGIARQLADVTRMSKTGDGMVELMTTWANITTGNSQPSQQVRRDVATAVAALESAAATQLAQAKATPATQPRGAQAPAQPAFGIAIVSRNQCLVPSGATVAAGAGLVVGNCAGGSGRWVGGPADSQGMAQLNASGSTLCMAAGANTGGTIAVALQPCQASAGNEQKWRMTPQGDIVSGAGGVCLAVRDGQSAVTAAPCNGLPSQKWRVFN